MLTHRCEACNFRPKMRLKVFRKRLACTEFECFPWTSSCPSKTTNKSGFNVYLVAFHHQIKCCPDQQRSRRNAKAYETSHTSEYERLFYFVLLSGSFYSLYCCCTIYSWRTIKSFFVAVWKLTAFFSSFSRVRAKQRHNWTDVIVIISAEWILKLLHEVHSI